MGRIVFDSTVQTLGATLQTEQGQEALRALADEVVDGLVEEFTAGTAEALLREALVDTLEQVKEAVSVRDWAER